jgi:hypothetical protein
MKFKKVIGTSNLQDGWYRASIEKIEEVEGQYGEQYLITFHIENGEDTTRRGYLSPYIGEHNRTKLFFDSLGISPEEAEDIDLETLLGLYLMIQLQTGDTKTGKRVQKIVAYAPEAPVRTTKGSVAKVKKVFTRRPEEEGE